MFEICLPVGVTTGDYRNFFDEHKHEEEVRFRVVYVGPVPEKLFSRHIDTTI